MEPNKIKLCVIGCYYWRCSARDSRFTKFTIENHFSMSWRINCSRYDLVSVFFMAQMETGGLTLGWHDDFKEILARLFVAKPVIASLGKGFCLNWFCVVCRQTTSLPYMHFRMLWWLICDAGSKIAYTAHVYNGLFQFPYAGGSQTAQKGKTREFLVQAQVTEKYRLVI